jgi:hypothetical protein
LFVRAPFRKPPPPPPPPTLGDRLRAVPKIVLALLVAAGAGVATFLRLRSEAHS